MKSPEHITTNGRAVFYASIWPDLRESALKNGWALGLHGSLNSDMDIMAMPWTEDAETEIIMIRDICRCFVGHEKLIKEVQISTDKPNNRVVYTIPIWADFYLDINVIHS